MRQAGDKIIYWTPDPHNDAGRGWIPRASNAEWPTYAKAADLIIVDGNFPSRRTRRSWGPSRWVDELAAIRRDAPDKYIGPVPTSELVENDQRYQRKVLVRFGMVCAQGALPEGAVPVTVHVDAPGGVSVVLRREGLDWSIPIPPGSRIALATAKIVEYLRTIRYRGPVAISCAVTEEHLAVRDVVTGFLYPAVCGGSLVSASQGGVVTISQQLGRESYADFAWSPYDDTPVIGGSLAVAHGDGRRARVVGKMCGTVVSAGRDVEEATGQASALVNKLLGEGWTATVPSGIEGPSELAALRGWRWIP